VAEGRKGIQQGFRSNLSAGDLLVLNIDLAAGTTAPLASAFVITSSTFAVTEGVTVSGNTVHLSKNRNKTVIPEAFLIGNQDSK
jgi:hypothetical protein